MAGARVILRKAVPNDLLEIVDYLAERNPDAADRFLIEVRTTLETLATRPGVGSPKAFRGKELAGIRSWHVNGFRDFLIVYKPVDGGIEVWGVMYGSRNIGAHLRKRGRR
jgi:toxin ParE1/3/4